MLGCNSVPVGKRETQTYETFIWHLQSSSGDASLYGGRQRGRILSSAELQEPGFIFERHCKMSCVQLASLDFVCV